MSSAFTSAFGGSAAASGDRGGQSNRNPTRSADSGNRRNSNNNNNNNNNNNRKTANNNSGRSQGEGGRWNDTPGRRGRGRGAGSGDGGSRGGGVGGGDASRRSNNNSHNNNNNSERSPPRGNRGGGRGGSRWGVNGGGDAASSDGAARRQRAFKLAQPPVFQGILDGGAAASAASGPQSNTPLPRSVQQQQPQRGPPPPFNAGGVVFGAPAMSGPPGHSVMPAQDGAQGNGGNSSGGVFGHSSSGVGIGSGSPAPASGFTSPSGSPSPGFGTHSMFQQVSAITPGSQSSLLSAPSPPASGSSGSSFSTSILGATPASGGPSGSVLGVLSPSPAAVAATVTQEASGANTSVSGGNSGGILSSRAMSTTSTPQRTPAQGEPTGMPPPTPHGGFKSIFNSGAVASSSPGVPAAAAAPAFGGKSAFGSASSSAFSGIKRGRSEDEVREDGSGDGEEGSGSQGARATATPFSTPLSKSAFGQAGGLPRPGNSTPASTPAPTVAAAASPSFRDATPPSSSGAFGRPLKPASTAGAAVTYRPNTQPSSAQPRRPSGTIAAPRASSTKSYCYAARLFMECATKLLAPSDAVQETAGPVLARIFFDPLIGRAGVHADFEETASEMLAVWQEVSYLHASGKKNASDGTLAEQAGAAWAAAAAIGAQLNMVCTTLLRARTVDPASQTNATASSTSELETYTRVVVAHPAAATLDACKQANRLAHLIQFFYTNQQACHVPFSVLSPLIRRVRATFEEAQRHSLGELAISSDLPSALRTTFRTLNTKVRALMKDNALVVQSVVDTSVVMAYAHLVIEMMSADISNSEDVTRFITAFHKACPDAADERFVMYYRVANSYLTSAFAVTTHVQQAAQLLAHALALCPEDTPDDTQRRVFGQLAAAKLACGEIPRPEDLIHYKIPELLDVVAAVRASSLKLMDVAIRRHAVFFVELGVHNMVEIARQRVALLLVVKFFQLRQGAQQLNVREMVTHFELPYQTSVEANLCWLLPLLMQKSINGVLDGETLILSKKDPFPGYPMDLILAADATGDVLAN